MPEQVKRLNPWRKMMMMMYHTAARSFVCETTPRALPTQTKLPGKKGVRTKNAELYTAEYSIVGHCYIYLYNLLTLQNPRFQKWTDVEKKLFRLQKITALVRMLHNLFYFPKYAFNFITLSFFCNKILMFFVNIALNFVWHRQLSRYIDWATGWTVRDGIPVGTRFSTRPDRPWGPSNLL